MVIEIESIETRPLEEIIEELTDMICRNAGQCGPRGPGIAPPEILDGVRKMRVSELLVEFAEEIKRQAIEP